MTNPINPTMENWSICGSPYNNEFMAPEQKRYLLCGNVYGHPKGRHYDGKAVQTSYILNIDMEAGTVQTKSRIYRLGLPSLEYAKAMREQEYPATTDYYMKIMIERGLPEAKVD